MQKVWITSLSADESNVKSLIGLLKAYHINADGHFWVDDLPQMAWSLSKESLVAKDTQLWLIVTDQASLQSASILKGLAALALMVEAERPGLAMLMLITDASSPPALLPTPLKRAETLAFNTPGLAAKIVARLNLPVVQQDYGYRLNLYPLRELGLWIELGPTHPSVWQGVMFGVRGAEITFQADGPKGSLPQQSTLEYPEQGLKVKLAAAEFSAWAVRNVVDGNRSYFARIDQLPEQILFSAYANADETEAYVLNFC